MHLTRGPVEGNSLDLDAARAGPAVFRPPDSSSRDSVSRSRGRVLNSEESCREGEFSPLNLRSSNRIESDLGDVPAVCAPARSSAVHRVYGSQGSNFGQDSLGRRDRLFGRVCRVRAKGERQIERRTLGQALEAVGAAAVQRDILVTVHGSRCRDGRGAKEGGGGGESGELHSGRELDERGSGG